MLLSEHYRDPSWPKGWHIYRPVGYQQWRSWYETDGRFEFNPLSSDKQRAIEQMRAIVEEQG